MQAVQAVADRRVVAARRHPAAAVESARRIRGHEIDDRRARHGALVVVEAVLEEPAGARAAAEHQIPPTTPLELARPSGNRADFDIKSRRGVSDPFADSDTAFAF